MTIIILLLAALALVVVLFYTARGNAAKIDGVDGLQGLTEPLDLPAFRNLMNPEEEEFLRTNLPPRDFRRVQRERLGAATAYVRCAARNAAVLVRLGEATSVEASAEVSQVGQELVTEAIRLRAFAILALCMLYIKMAVPDSRLSLVQVPRLYEHVIGRVGYLARLKRPAQAGHILQAL
jgi:hypothetical protein